MTTQPTRFQSAALPALAFLFGLTIWISLASTAGAQNPDIPLPVETGESGITVAWTFPIKLAIYLFLVTTGLIVCYFLIFPSLLRKARPAWPMDAYGVASACAWGLVFGLSLGVFWDDLVLENAPVSDVLKSYLPRGVILIVGILGVILCLRYCRSKFRPATA